MPERGHGNVELIKLLMQGWQITRVRRLPSYVQLTEVTLGVQTDSFGKPIMWLKWLI